VTLAACSWPVASEWVATWLAPHAHPARLAACPPHIHVLQVRCAARKLDCYIYRLAPPCFRGRCFMDPDPTLLSSVFSETEQMSDTPS